MVTAAERMAQRVEDGIMRRRERISVEYGGGGGDNGGMDELAPRVAVLEQIAKDTQGVLKEIKEDLRAMRTSQERDFRFMFGAIITASLGLGGLMLGLLGIVAHGFHWIG